MLKSDCQILQLELSEPDSLINYHSHLKPYDTVIITLYMTVAVSFADLTTVKKHLYMTVEKSKGEL